MTQQILLKSESMESKENYLKNATRLDHFIEEFSNSKEKIILSNPDWDVQDARLVVFNKINQILNGFAISFSHLHREFINFNWFESLYPKELATEDNHEKLCTEFEKFIGSGVVLLLYGAVESSLRIISHKLDSTKYPMNMPFSALFQKLLPDLDLKQYVNLLMIWSNLRNTVHNNGIFLSRNAEYLIIEYKNQKFVFENGKQHGIIGWNMYFELIIDLLKMVSSIIESKGISSIKKIPDTSII